jgi:hypothetical protein
MFRRLGFVTNGGLIGMVLTLLIVSGVVLARGNELFSPGALNDQTGAALGGHVSHADIGGECSLCHTAPWEKATMADRCVKCHAEVAFQLQDAATLHGVLFKNNTGLKCRTCHPEHRGPNSPVTALEGVNFPHDSFGFSLKAHKGNIFSARVGCTDCHGNDFTHVDPLACGTCHVVRDVVFTQAHLLTFGADCLACHDGLETYGKKFDHQTVAFPLNGKHSEINCTDCHLGQHSISELQSTPQSCSNCHQKDEPHAGNFGFNCATCHTTEAWKPAKIDHDQTSFTLEGKHLDVPCEKCHKNAIFTGTPKECVGCHAQDDNHQGKFGTNCAVCHTVAGWKPANFDHNLASFKLDGKHIKVACESCHVNDIYKGTPTNCYACHAASDHHNGSYGTNCATCHATSGWLPVNFDHSKAAFQLNGKHLNVACESCHINGVYKGTATNCYACHAATDHHNGSFGNNCATCHTTSGWLPANFNHSLSVFKLTGKHLNVACQNCHINGVYKGTATNCYACHAASDHHNGSNGTNCATCHSTSGWLPAIFDHNLSAFKLTGKHLNVACQNCHINGIYKGTATNCFACHASSDHHNGSNGTNCATCHSTSGWLPAIFDHNLSAFKLTGKHLNVACQNCHINGVYKGTPTNCYACHASADHHNGSYGTNCGSCHTTSGWLPASFDHNLAAFKLTGRHLNVACLNCHVNGVYKGTPTTCYACHASADHHGGSYGTNCGSCHTTSGWLPASFDHNLAAFKLTGKHLNVACLSCHVNGVYKGTPTTCYACHASADHHGGSYGTNCGSCHTTSGWLPASFDHNLAAFKLTGAHLGVQCTTCHVNGVYKGTASACVACHSEPAFHAGVFGTNCAQCHTTSNWSASYTGSHPDVDGRNGTQHQHASCKDCHTVNLSTATCTKCHDSNNPGN